MLWFLAVGHTAGYLMASHTQHRQNGDGDDNVVGHVTQRWREMLLQTLGARLSSDGPLDSLFQMALDGWPFG